VAHALEQVSGYRIPHGEAVGLGLIAECRIAERMGLASEGLSAQVAGLLSKLALPTRHGSAATVDQLLEAMTQDKKNRAGAIRMALPSGLGRMHEGEGWWTVPVERRVVEEGLAAIG
jgi:3-dehydroquinate synthetase